MSVNYFLNNPDYALRWPPELFAEQVRRLYQRGEAWGVDHEWSQEVVVLLKQAFESSVPVADFSQIDRGRLDHEPF